MAKILALEEELAISLLGSRKQKSLKRKSCQNVDRRIKGSDWKVEEITRATSHTSQEL